MRTPVPWDLPRTPFTLANAEHLGVSARRVRCAAARGDLVRLRHGVYVAADAVPADAGELHVMRALAHQMVASSLVASDETAALALGLALPWSERAVRGPLRFSHEGGPGSRSRPGSLAAVRIARLPAAHVVVLPSGLRTTTAVRTAVDLAARYSLPEALMVLDSAARLEVQSRIGTLSRSSYRHHHLAADASRVIADVASAAVPGRVVSRLGPVLGLVDIRHETPIESVGAAHFHLAGFPRSIPQAEVPTDVGVFAVDRLFPEYGVIVEFDGEVKYADPRATILEKEREWYLRDRGHEVVRCTGREILARPHVMLDRTARVLRGRGWPG